MAEQLLKENQDLQAQIDALKQKLQLDQADADQARANAKKVFDAFDKDGNGTIDASEFELLAFGAGANPVLLAPERQAEEFAKIDTDGSGTISFEEFYVWLQGAGAAGDAVDEDVRLLRLKLSSRSWWKKFSEGKDHYLERLRRMAPEQKDNEQAKPADAVDQPTPNVGSSRFKIGNPNPEKGSSITWSIKRDVEKCTQLRQDLEVEEGKGKHFVVVDVALTDDFDEDGVAELCGQLDLAFAAIPFDMVPDNLQPYESHAVDVVEGEDGTNLLRLVIYLRHSLVDIMHRLDQMQGADELPRMPIRDEDFAVGQGHGRVLLPVSLDDVFADPGIPFSAEEHLCLLAEGQMQLNTGNFLYDANAEDLNEAQLAMRDFYREVERVCRSAHFAMDISSWQEFVEDYPEHLRHGSNIGRAIDMVESMEGQEVFGVVPLFLASQLGNFAGMVAPYMAGLRCLVGLRAIHLVMFNELAQVNFKGLDLFKHIVPFLEADSGMGMLEGSEGSEGEE